MSSRSAEAGAAIVLFALEPEACAALSVLSSNTAITAVAATSRIFRNTFLRFMFSPREYLEMNFSMRSIIRSGLVALRRRVSSGFGFIFGHEFAGLGFAVPASALVIDLALG